MTTQDKPNVDFNFDQWERETAIDPFGVIIAGKHYVAIDPLEIDIRKFSALMDGSDVQAQIRMLFPESHEAILGTKTIKAGAYQAFTEKVVKHYGLDPTAA